jgi:UDP-glucuronate 4-epimerase
MCCKNEFFKSTILVTGAAGFIGFHAAKRLLKEGWKVLGIDNLNAYYDVRLKHARLAELGIETAKLVYGKKISSSTEENFVFVQLNLEDGEGMQALFADGQFGAVCHLAAQPGVRYSMEDPMAYINSNVVGFTNILEQSRLHGIEHLVYASSSSVYGLNADMPYSPHKAVNHPVSLYAATKKSNELMAHVYSSLYKLPTTGLRFFTVYGPWGRPDMSPMLFADAIMHEKPLKVFNNGEMERDFTYVDDIVEGLVRVIVRPAQASADWDPAHPDPASSCVPYRIYNIGSSAPVRLIEYIETLELALGKKALKEFLPMQPGDVLNTYCDVSDLEKEFGYRPSTSLEVGLHAFADWYKRYNAIE